ncbi:MULTISPECIES: ABC transporter ATP-binding protein [Burkholderiaceae]|uniref:ABC transporter ATP-binding protein n=1 Tax=Burkholderiaceae TaxID=119060 RepID=UPI0009699BFD|nr:MULTISPECIES: ABC transporter ATP-binding protein [Burkholderiaceae]MCF2134202.1 ABC transporter ATP-binding protein [Mycetohabitans sp. B3]MCG1019937.1 ABC transporter ATP-binding protein [Mycetohabitans sp. B4]MCG1039446.1 ABC transporter ATP-binding protein [Mycetohabitans sp. B7]SIT65104.1 putative spermidine/putrescine transport system ATP-binding protein [Burkholderia sp. b14]SIT81471.1 putative spermidine/putrescine transport system ATP-binding protein [Burkholderia sp. b13]
MSLVLDRVSYQYPGTGHGLTDISFEVETGEMVAVIGASGSGKSTLLKVISGLISEASGSITLDGENLAGKPVHKRNIGMVFQNYALFPHLNVIENVAYGLALKKIPLKNRLAKAAELLETVGLENFATRPVYNLSGGQQQRVALARALAIDPKALLLDEPLAALDVGIRGYLRDQIRSIQKKFNATTILVTHDQEEALTLSDYVAVLKDGKLLQFGSPKNIYCYPNSRAVAEFVGLSTLLPAKISAHNQVDLGFAQIAANTDGRRLGEKVLILIRPEHVVKDPPEGTLNYLVGCTVNQRYLGSVVRYDFQVNGASKPIVGEAIEVPVSGISIPPQCVQLLDDDPSQEVL